jgi:signal transduction histidine kinase
VRIHTRLGVQRLRARLPRRTIRLRLALAYFGLFVVSAAGLLALTIVLWRATTNTVTTRTGGSRARVPATSAVKAPQGISIQHSTDLHQLLVMSGIALAVFAAVSITLGWLVAGRFLQPLHTITTAAKDISATNLQERLNLKGPDDELKELGDTFDGLLARLERSFYFERQFVANASHELRTPNATMRVWLDVAMAKPEPVPPHIVALAARLRHELDHVDQLLDSFVALAHAQGAPIDDESTFRLGDITSAAIACRASAISEMDLTIDDEQGSETWVTGSETLLTRAVENVIDNAVKHNERSGWVRVKTTANGPTCSLVVENGGPLLHQDEVDELARPFRRLGAQRTGSDRGSGLGLSIVESIAEVHGGTLDLQARTDGGLRVVITLPLAEETAVGARA